MLGRTNKESFQTREEANCKEALPPPTMKPAVVVYQWPKRSGTMTRKGGIAGLATLEISAKTIIIISYHSIIHHTRILDKLFSPRASRSRTEIVFLAVLVLKKVPFSPNTNTVR